MLSSFSGQGRSSLETNRKVLELRGFSVASSDPIKIKMVTRMVIHLIFHFNRIISSESY
jgi:hypothetical protein